MTHLTKLVARYDYPLPKKCIALSPAEPRERAKLLVYDRVSGRVAHDRFINLSRYLAPASLLVFNETKVLPARLRVCNQRGAPRELLFVDWRDGAARMLSAKRLTVSSRLECGPLVLRVVKKTGQYYYLKVFWRNGIKAEQALTLTELQRFLLKHGEAPLPPYLKRTKLSPGQLRQKYQAVFAKNIGAIAAPTASLHFSNELLENLKNVGHHLAFITLHVGLGTFARLTEDNVNKGELHQEFFEIKPAAAASINRAKTTGQKVVAVGTTVTRALESAARAGGVAAGTGQTRLFIRPGYQFKIIDQLVTNFHVPGSSLMMLVAALIGRTKLLSIYRQAAQKDYRFFSFGDGMLLR